MTPPTPPRILCPHCRAPIDSLALDNAAGMTWEGSICPECDGMIILASTHTTRRPDPAPATPRAGAAMAAPVR